jgi:hypothetical protein
MSAYPQWFYYPSRNPPPEWVPPFVNVVAQAKPTIGSASVSGLTSDLVLGHLRDGLLGLGFRVEGGKTRSQKIHLPVLFGDNGIERVAYEVDAFHERDGVAVEVEAGRGARGNAVYRDLIRASLLVGVRYLALGVMLSYSGKDVSVASYSEAHSILDAIYASGRLKLPFEGVLLFGY